MPSEQVVIMYVPTLQTSHHWMPFVELHMIHVFTGGAHTGMHKCALANQTLERHFVLSPTTAMEGRPSGAKRIGHRAHICDWPLRMQ